MVVLLLVTDPIGNIPLFYIPAVAVLNPKFVAEYELPGSLVAVWTHVEYIKAVK